MSLSLQPLICILVIDSSLSLCILCRSVIHPPSLRSHSGGNLLQSLPRLVNGDTDGGRMAAVELCSIQIVKYNANGESRIQGQ